MDRPLMIDPACLVRVTPMLHVPNFAEALRFFVEVLGFDIPFRMTNYAYVDWGGAGIRVLEELGREPAPLDQARTTVYFDVQDVDAVYEQLKNRLAALPGGDVHPPRDQHWGQRELLVRMPDGNWLAFGQPCAHE